MLMHPRRSTTLLALLLVGAATLPSAARAQQGAEGTRGEALAVPATATNPAPDATIPALVGPRLAPAGPSVAPVDLLRGATASPFPPLPPQDRVRAGPNIAMMAVGGAALVAGLIIGGDGGLVIAAVGGAVGLVGLYRYLR